MLAPRRLIRRLWPDPSKFFCDPVFSGLSGVSPNRDVERSTDWNLRGNECGQSLAAPAVSVLLAIRDSPKSGSARPTEIRLEPNLDLAERQLANDWKCQRFESCR